MSPCRRCCVKSQKPKKALPVSRRSFPVTCYMSQIMVSHLYPMPLHVTSNKQLFFSMRLISNSSQLANIYLATKKTHKKDGVF